MQIRNSIQLARALANAVNYHHDTRRWLVDPDARFDHRDWWHRLLSYDEWRDTILVNALRDTFDYDTVECNNDVVRRVEAEKATYCSAYTYDVLQWLASPHYYAERVQLLNDMLDDRGAPADVVATLQAMQQEEGERLTRLAGYALVEELESIRAFEEA